MANPQVYLDSSEPCYLFTPPEATSSSGRPAKKRKVAPNAKRPISQLPQLFDGNEKVESANRRFEIYEELWSAQERELEAVLEDTNAATIDRVCAFLDEDIENDYTGQLRAGLIISGLAASSTGSTLPTIKERLKSESKILTVRISPAQCPNLKAALRSIISEATQQSLDDDDEEGLRRGHQVYLILDRPKKLSKVLEDIRLLNYDLQGLENWVVQKSLEKVVIFLQESEAFDGSVLTELVDVLNSWQDRINFILLIEIGTSVELFQEKLSRQAIHQLQGTLFETKSATEVLDALFRCATSPDVSRCFWLGAGTSRLLLDRQTEHVQSAKDFISTLKYMYMMHFFNNPLSLFTPKAVKFTFSKDQLSAFSSLPSFKRYISQLLKEGKKGEAAELTRNTASLSEFLNSHISQTHQTLWYLSQALEVIRIIYSFINSSANPTWSTLYIKAMSGELAESTVIRDLSLSLRKLPSDIMSQLIDAMSPMLDLGSISERLNLLNADHSRPLHSEHDQQHSTLRTTVVAQKVSLSKHQATLSAGDTEYSELVKKIDTELRTFFDKHLVIPKDQILHEVFVFDSKALCRDVFGPAPRKAVERALGSPHDYLDCECCEGEEGLKASHPATSILYQLYLESGSMVNIADMWAAFQAIAGTDNAEGEEDDAQNGEHLALFYRALAELRYLGMIKGSRKKTDHVAKLRWKGL